VIVTVAEGTVDLALDWVMIDDGGYKADEPIPYVLAENVLSAYERAALDIAERQGTVTSGQLARAAGIGPEWARQVLVRMGRRGLLQAEGWKRGRRYVLP
jgi:predicted HTH transcriptional regulator